MTDIVTVSNGDIVVLITAMWLALSLHITISTALLQRDLRDLHKQIKDAYESVSCTGRYVCYNKKK